MAAPNNEYVVPEIIQLSVSVTIKVLLDINLRMLAFEIVGISLIGGEFHNEHRVLASSACISLLKLLHER